MSYYSDINLSLEKQRNGDVKKCEDKDAVRNSIINISETIQGHRVMLPDFAFNGYNILFEPITKESGSIIGSLIWQSIEKWDERVEINNIHVDLKPDEHQYVIYIYYHILNITSETEPDVVRIVLTQL